MRPNWVVNALKYDRALKEVKDSGKDVTDEAVKAVYVRMAGLLLEEAAPEIQANENLPEVKAKKGKK
jgi:hypothetical protein